MVMIFITLCVMAVLSVSHSTEAVRWGFSNQEALQIPKASNELERSCTKLRSIIGEMQNVDLAQMDLEFASDVLQDAEYTKNLYRLLCSNLYRASQSRNVAKSFAMIRRGWREELLASMLKGGN